MLDDLHLHIQIFIAALSGVLVIATLIVAVMRFRSGAEATAELVARMKSWWYMVAVVYLAVVTSKTAMLVLIGFLSFLALKEYFSLIPVRRIDRRTLFWAYLSIPLQFYWISIEWYGMFIIFIPVYMFLFLPMNMVFREQSSGYLKAVGVINWGLMTTVFSLGHAAYLLYLPEEVNSGNGGGVSLLLFLLLVTELNDIAQYLWGKKFGKRKVLPQISPNKTWAGFLGGVATTVVISALVAPWMTPMSYFHSLLAGLLVGVSGFVGDITISAVKRDIGVKDSGSMLPGHGGILDRVDSLTYTAPLFFHYIYYLYY